jgi:hypothetical protein
MEFEENIEQIEGNSTRNLKEKHKEFFTRVIFRFFFGFFNNGVFLHKKAREGQFKKFFFA